MHFYGRFHRVRVAPALLAFALVLPAVVWCGPIETLAGVRQERAKDGGLARRGRVGFTFVESSSGLVIREIGRNTPAAGAGLHPGDIVTSVDGARVVDRSTLLNRVRTLRAGDSLKLGVSRDGSETEVTLSIDEVPREGDLDAKAEYGAFPGAQGRLRSVWSHPARSSSSKRQGILIIRGVGSPAADAPGNNPFRDLAFHFAHQGYIAMRYDAAGLGDSEGGPNASVDFDTEVADARAALAHLRSDPRVDADRIVLLGQGTGGGVAAVVASGDEKIAGLIVVGTIARPLMEYVLESRRAQLGLAGVAPGDVDQMIREHVGVFGQLNGSGDLAADPSGIVEADGTVLGKLPPFWRQYDRVNFAKIYSQLKVPVMNAIGEFDFVSTIGDHRAIAEALKAKGQSDQVIVVLDRTDHDLRQFESREAAYVGFGSTEAPVNERALYRISDWIRDNVKRVS